MHHLYYAVVLASLFVHCQCDAGTRNLTQCDGKEKASTLLDMATNFLNNSKLFFPDCNGGDLNCAKCEKSLAFLEFASSLMSKTKEILPTCQEHECPDPVRPEQINKPMDCWEVLESGKNESGVYTIWPRSRVSNKKPLSVYCDMETDGGGWTVIQRRGNFSTPKDYFYKDWKNYKTGFGELKEEFWLGNDNIYAISNQGSYTIRFDLRDEGGVTGYAHYDAFWIEDEKSFYTLHIYNHTGDVVGDSMLSSNTGLSNNNMKFSTKDKDNDNWDKSCAVDEQGAWWYNKCGSSNLNALNQPGVTSDKGIYWVSFRGKVGLSGSEMKLRPQRI